jgi:hypothetical protein
MCLFLRRKRITALLFSMFLYLPKIIKLKAFSGSPHLPQFSLKTDSLNNIRVATNIKDKNIMEEKLPTKTILVAVADREQFYFHPDHDCAKGTPALQTCSP